MKDTRQTSLIERLRRSENDSFYRVQELWKMRLPAETPGFRRWLREQVRQVVRRLRDARADIREYGDGDAKLPVLCGDGFVREVHGHSAAISAVDAAICRANLHDRLGRQP